MIDIAGLADKTQVIGHRPGLNNTTAHSLCQRLIKLLWHKIKRGQRPLCVQHLQANCGVRCSLGRAIKAKVKAALRVGLRRGDALILVENLQRGICGQGVQKTARAQALCVIGDGDVGPVDRAVSDGGGGRRFVRLTGERDDAEKQHRQGASPHAAV